MTTTTAALFDWQLNVLKPKNRIDMTDKEQLTPVTFELYPVEVLEAAQKVLGDKKLNEYAVELYKFAIASKAKGLPIKVSQISGVLLTQNKLDKWFSEVSPTTLLSTGVSETVFIAYANYHKERIAESEKVIQTLLQMVGLA